MQGVNEELKIVSYEVFIREARELERLLEKETCVKDIGDRIWFINVGNRTVEMGLNIAATGRISERVAARFGYCIIEAAKLAKGFKYNGYTISYSE